MATWVRQGTGTAPTSFDLDLVGQYALDNATAPGDFDPAGVTSVRTQWTITGSGFNDDSWDNVAGVAFVGGVSSTEISQHPAEGSTTNQNVVRASDHTDSTGIPSGLTVADWEAAFVRGDGTLIPNEWCLWNKVMGPDGSTLTVSVLTVTITYTPASAEFNGTASASLAFTTSGQGFAEYSGTASAAVALTASAQGFTEYSGTAAASLAFTASGTGEFLEYAIFRRTPQTGAVFDPDLDTPIAEVVTSPYVDLNLAAAGYDYQVFRRTASGWSSGSNVEQATVSAGDFNGQGSASLAFTASATGVSVYEGTGSAALVLSASADGFGVYEGTGAASLAFTASGTGNFGAPEFNGQGSAALVLSATADGFAVSDGTASAALVFTASGQGDAGVPTFNGQGSANLVFTTSGTGDHVPPDFNATGAANLVLTATGTGQYVPAGFNGQASANLAFTVSATGAFDPTWSGTGFALVEFSASGTGAYEPAVYAGSASANLVFTASAIGTEGALPTFRVEQGAVVSDLVEAGQVAVLTVEGG